MREYKCLMLQIVCNLYSTQVGDCDLSLASIRCMYSSFHKNANLYLADFLLLAACNIINVY